MRELQVVRPVGPAFRARDDMIDGGALFRPDARVRGVEPVAQHRRAAQRTEAGLPGPQGREALGFSTAERLAHAPSLGRE